MHYLWKLLVIVMSITILECAHYDDDINIPDDYDDAIFSQDEEISRQETHHFKHVEVKSEADDRFSKVEKKEETSTQGDSRGSNVVYHKRDHVTDDILSGAKYDVGKILEPGNYIEITGVYNPTSSFSINLIDDNGNYLYHASIRVRWAVIFNSYLGAWGTEVPAYFPTGFRNGKAFKITIVCMATYYKFYLDDKAVPQNFTYRRDIADIKYVLLSGGTGRFEWTGLNIPDGRHSAYAIYLGKTHVDVMEQLSNTITQNVAGKTLIDVKAYTNSDEGSLAINKCELLKHIKDKGDFLDMTDPTMQWILNDREAIETFMTSGDADNYKKALQILVKIIIRDPQAKSGIRLRLAVAVALTFSNDVHSLALLSNLIDPLTRYDAFIKWMAKDVFFLPFYKLTAWHLRYVVGSWAENEELVWARNNILPEFKNAQKVADVTHSMVSYNLENKDGVSVDDRAAFYYYKPVTLENIAKVGGVCGAISKFAAAMAQAHGIPALPVVQPGHCAYMWYRNGEWVLGNDMSGWPETYAHGGIQYTWKKHAAFFPIMNKAQSDLTSYRLSEKMRIASKFANSADKFILLEDATTECPQNYDAWMDMKDAIIQPSLKLSALQSALEPILVKFRKVKPDISNIALLKKVTADCSNDKAKFLTAMSNAEWVCSKKTLSFEIDFGTPTKISEIKIRWWGNSKSSDYDLLALDKDGKYNLVRTEDDERVEGYFNHWSYIPGWDIDTVKLKVDMRDGELDVWYKKYYFGIRQFQVLGIELDNVKDVSSGKTTTSNPESVGSENLVDGSYTTVWNGNTNKSWFKIDLEKVCVLEKMRFNWVDGRGVKSMKVVHRVGDGIEHIHTYNGIQKDLDFSSGPELIGSEVRVILEGGEKILTGVEVEGVSYTVKDLLKMKVRNTFGIYSSNTAEVDLLDNIDEFNYEQ